LSALAVNLVGMGIYWRGTHRDGTGIRA